MAAKPQRLSRGLTCIVTACEHEHGTSVLRLGDVMLRWYSSRLVRPDLVLFASCTVATRRDEAVLPGV
ncbi:hypothetical protein ASF84_00525 [Pseudomonas sp. Leaf127]|nr:hypothetical protein ASF84_00525 [Pseudomonas sp. Leaf127]